jgi:hypothetical protein
MWIWGNEVMSNQEMDYQREGAEMGMKIENTLRNNLNDWTLNAEEFNILADYYDKNSSQIIKATWDKIQKQLIDLKNALEQWWDIEKSRIPNSYFDWKIDWWEYKHQLWKGQVLSKEWWENFIWGNYIKTDKQNNFWNRPIPWNWDWDWGLYWQRNYSPNSYSDNNWNINHGNININIGEDSDIDINIWWKQF